MRTPLSLERILQHLLHGRRIGSFAEQPHPSPAPLHRRTEPSFREQLVAAGRSGSYQRVLKVVEQREGPDLLHGW
jgi:hypothetical protein